MMQPTLAGFKKKPRVEETPHESIVCSNSEYVVVYR